MQKWRTTHSFWFLPLIKLSCYYKKTLVKKTLIKLFWAWYHKNFQLMFFRRIEFLLLIGTSFISTRWWNLSLRIIRFTFKAPPFLSSERSYLEVRDAPSKPSQRNIEPFSFVVKGSRCNKPNKITLTPILKSLLTDIILT